MNGFSITKSHFTNCPEVSPSFLELSLFQLHHFLDDELVLCVPISQVPLHYSR